MCWVLTVDSAQPTVTSWFSRHLLNFLFKKPGSRHFFRFSFIFNMDTWSDRWDLYQKSSHKKLYNICENWAPLIFLRVLIDFRQVWLKWWRKGESFYLNSILRLNKLLNSLIWIDTLSTTSSTCRKKGSNWIQIENKK